MRWFEKHLPGDGSVAVEALGVKLRRPVDRRTESAGSAGQGHARRHVERGIPVHGDPPHRISAWRPASSAASATPAISATRSGWRRNTSAHVFDALMEAGEEFGIGLFGSRALNALQAGEKLRLLGARIPADLRPARSRARPLRRLCQGGRFHRQGGAPPKRKAGGKLRLRAFIVDAEDADMIGDEPIWFDGAVRGWVTSGGYAHNSKASVAMGYVPKEIADESDGFEIELLGKRLCRAHPAGAAVRRQFRADAGVRDRTELHETTSQPSARQGRPRSSSTCRRSTGRTSAFLQRTSTASSPTRRRCMARHAATTFRHSTTPMSSMPRRPAPLPSRPAGWPFRLQRQGRSADRRSARSRLSREAMRRAIDRAGDPTWHTASSKCGGH